MQIGSFLKSLPKRHLVTVRCGGLMTSCYAKTLLEELPSDSLNAKIVSIETFGSGTEVRVRKKHESDRFFG